MDTGSLREAAIDVHDAADGQAPQEQRTGLAVGNPPTGQQESERAAGAVRERVDLGRAAAP